MAGVASSLSASAAAHGPLEASIANIQTVLSEEQRRELQDIKKGRRVPDADSVLIFTARLDAINRQRKGRSISNRLHPLLSSVESFCNVLTNSKLSNITDTYVSSHPEISALIWGSMKLTMTVNKWVPSPEDKMD
jgi:hypothetical protein